MRGLLFIIFSNYIFWFKIIPFQGRKTLLEKHQAQCCVSYLFQPMGLWVRGGGWIGDVRGGDAVNVQVKHVFTHLYIACFSYFISINVIFHIIFLVLHISYIK